MKRRLTAKQFRRLIRRLLHQSASGGRAVKPARGPNQLLILIPAFNEVGAIAGVIREVRGVMPGRPHSGCG